MLRRNVILELAMAGVFAVAAGCADGQSIPRSQRGVIIQHISHAVVTVAYSRPVARGRDLFPGVVAFGRAWNPGADRATHIELTADIVIEGQPLPAGKYSIWAIPDADEWTVIFHRDWDVFHVPYPGEADDQLRVTVAPGEGEHLETMTWHFPVVDGANAVLAFHWGTTVVELSISVP